jgi:predicted nucleic acid-binding protein
VPVLPTHLKKFSDIPLPEVIYFDTSFVIKCLVDGESHFTQCRKFLKRLKEEQPIVVFSTFLRAELWNTRLVIIFQDLEKMKHIDFNECRRKYPTACIDYYSQISEINKLFDELLQSFKEWVESPVNDKIMNIALVLMKKYNLLSYDSIHIATMLDWGIKDIAVFDKHIEDIIDLTIWTDGGLRRYKERHNL